MLHQSKFVVALLVVGLVLAGCTAALPVASAGILEAMAPSLEQEPRVLSFDVAEDMTRFVFDQDRVYEDGLPADGAAFITRGYLYAAGTLTDSNGVNADGSPEFPNQVIGEWICQGYMINDAGHASGGVWVFSTQFFQFGDEPGAESIVTQGYELADVNIAIARAITGGTGEFKHVRGESTQTLLGLNASEGVNLRVEVVLN